MFSSSGLVGVVAVLDAVIMNLGFVAAFLVRFGLAVPAENLRAFIIVSPYTALAVVVLFLLLGLYAPRFRRSIDLVCYVAIGVAFTDVATMAITFFARAFAFPRTVFALGFVLQVCLLSLWRILVQRVAAAALGTKRVVVIGNKGDAHAVARKVGALIGGKYEVTQVLDLDGLEWSERASSACRRPAAGRQLAAGRQEAVTGQEAATRQQAAGGEQAVGGRQQGADEEQAAACLAGNEDGTDGARFGSRDATPGALVSAISSADVVCVASSLPTPTKEAVLSTCLGQDKEVLLIPELCDILLHKAEMTALDDLPVFRIQPLSLTQTQRALKRAFDLALAIPLCVLLFPLMATTAIAILLTSPGPVLFIQPRVGEGGRVFRLVKLRTMAPDSERDTGPVLATVNDPRVTRIGRFLRATRLDELPQLLNVVAGDMSFVGPRPERPFFVSRYQDEIPDYKYRFRVKPGITGLAQVEGKYDSEAGDKLRYDLYYIRNYSLLLDIRLILQTLRMPFAPASAVGVAKGRVKSQVQVGGVRNNAGDDTARPDRSQDDEARGQAR